ncbi:MAG: FtsQ-type POTRA domain-containing protein [Verrucomicrobiae bacterium]|nr:FtsQ-type POTRA domain-containing protein [Verrucomicrobiae bacterium]
MTPRSSSRSGPRRRRSARDLDTLLAASTRRRGRSGRWWGRPLAVLCLVALVYFGGGWTLAQARERWLHRIDRLAIQRIEVLCDGILTPSEIREIAGIAVGRNVLTVDPFQVRERLRRHPRIEDAHIRLDFPDAVQISVRERYPVARLVLPRMGTAEPHLLVDASGYVFMPFQPGTAPAEVIASEAALPALHGVPAGALLAGRTIADRQVRAALGLLSAFDESPLAQEADLISVDLGAAPLLTVLTRGGAIVTLAADREFADQLARWFSVHRFGLASGLRIASLDLSVVNNPPLRWMDPGDPADAAPSSSPATPGTRPQRKPGRRHV